MMMDLHLNQKRQWFNMVDSGQKKEEYREIKDHWARRLLVFNSEIESIDEMLADMNNPWRRHNGPDALMSYFNVSFRSFKAVIFRNGYARTAPEIKVEIPGISIGQGKPEWGAEKGKYCFIIKLGVKVG